MKHLSIMATALGLLLSTTAMAAPERQGPPKEAIEACASAKTGDSCSFSGRQGETIPGTCESKRDDKLVCAPENPPARN
ncbi:hypothetical protein Q4508_09910 [Amphritea sp. 2_MG-2023]|jgi:hypothetical protein|uniref:hypothetical protein n=1 Tax=Amphritea TaxID=515417 RepID=UPI001C067E17|nr:MULTISPECIES: hypothetical protein [Amphritea]MBU2965089.1 hypothetical protein [Amphritea atlantica]MDO6418874.1 hypothetical protein [Amphritea sp. 2_MG-2023]